MSENLQKLVGVVVMAVLVVVGVVVSSGDDTDYTRNVSFRDNPERLEGGDRLEDPDCCDQNAYEISLLQAKYEDLEAEIVAVQKALESADKTLEIVEKTLGSAEKTLESAEKTIEKLEQESCSNVDGSAKCAFIDHQEKVLVLEGVGAYWEKKSSGSNWCKLGEVMVQIGLNKAGNEVGVDAPEVDLCSSSSLELPGNQSVEETFLYQDDYLRLYLQCPHAMNLVPMTSSKYLKGVNNPTLALRQLSAEKFDYWLAPTQGSSHPSGHPLMFGENFGSKKIWKPGAVTELAAWVWGQSGVDQFGQVVPESFESESITVTIYDKENQETHYAFLTGTVGYSLVGGTAADLKNGTAKARCEGDLSVIRSYS